MIKFIALSAEGRERKGRTKMDHDQEKFYHGEEQEAQATTQEQPQEEVNDMVYFTELLQHLRVLIERGSKVPLTGKAIVDAESCLMVLNELELNLPDAIQYGMQMYSERSRIMGDAEETAMSLVSSTEIKSKKALENAHRKADKILGEAEAEAKEILDDAQERADRMISESEVVRQAREEARIIINDARVEAGEIRLKASHDVYRLASEAVQKLDSALQEVRGIRTEIVEEEQ